MQLSGGITSLLSILALWLLRTIDRTFRGAGDYQNSQQNCRLLKKNMLLIGPQTSDKGKIFR